LSLAQNGLAQIATTPGFQGFVGVIRWIETVEG
jgi:hypothetical protein